MTALGGETFTTTDDPPANFTTQCGDASFRAWEEHWEPAPYIFDLASDPPLIEFPEFHSASEDCKYEGYALYEDKDADQPDDRFDPAYQEVTKESEEGNVTFV